MKLKYKILIIWAVVTTTATVILAICYISIYCRSDNDICINYKMTDIVADNKIQIMDQLAKLGQQAIETNRYFKEKELELYDKLIKLDSSSTDVLYSYGSTAIYLTFETNDQKASEEYKQRCIWAAKRIIASKPTDALSVMYTAKLYYTIGTIDTSYYDSTYILYDNLVHMIESDSLEIPYFAIKDKLNYLKDLKSSIKASRQYVDALKNNMSVKYKFFF